MLKIKSAAKVQLIPITTKDILHFEWKISCNGVGRKRLTTKIFHCSFGTYFEKKPDNQQFFTPCPYIHSVTFLLPF